jgi:hypothetical protein
MTTPLHIGFTGTRGGMSLSQFTAVETLLRQHRAASSIIGHHGCCVGADAEFHRLLRRIDAFIVGHPGQSWPNGPLRVTLARRERRGRVACERALSLP